MRICGRVWLAHILGQILAMQKSFFQAFWFLKPDLFGPLKRGHQCTILPFKLVWLISNLE